MPPRVLNVAEKPSVAKEIARILNGGQVPRTREGELKYCKIYDFPSQIRCVRLLALLLCWVCWCAGLCVRVPGCLACLCWFVCGLYVCVPACLPGHASPHSHPLTHSHPSSPPTPPHPHQHRGENVDMVFTSVLGHLLELDFVQPYRSWGGCRPGDLFTAPVEKVVRACLCACVRG